MSVNNPNKEFTTVQKEALNEEPPQNETEAAIYGLVSGVSFGIGNTIITFVCKHRGLKWLYTICITPFLAWMFFHIYEHRNANKLRSQHGTGNLSFFDRSSSVYWQRAQDGSFIVNWTSVGTIVRRVIILVLTNICVNLTYQFSIEGGINCGALSTLFITGEVWVVIYYYFIHDQKLSRIDFVGISLMALGVICISFAKSLTKQDQTEMTKHNLKYEIFAIAGGLLVGFISFINVVEISYSNSHTKVRPLQANIDGICLTAICLIPLIIFEHLKDPNYYKVSDFMWSNLVICCIFGGQVCIGLGLQKGAAGRVIAPTQLQPVWQIVLLMVFAARIPNWAESLGCFFGLIGIALILLCKKEVTQVLEDQKEKFQTSFESFKSL